jgi:hypothetical protein
MPVRLLILEFVDAIRGQTRDGCGGQRMGFQVLQDIRVILLRVLRHVRELLRRRLIRVDVGELLGLRIVTRLELIDVLLGNRLALVLEQTGEILDEL